MEHHLKILENFADDILKNGKAFEVRRNDREFKTGDTIQFIALDANHGGIKEHPINEKTFLIEYVLRFEDFPAGLQEGFAVLAIKERKEAGINTLKPCPFCGGEAKIMDMGYPHWVYCENCGAKVHGRTHDEKDSVEAWNRREEGNDDD